MAIDGTPQGEAHEGLSFTIDGKPHELRFTCMKDECEPLAKAIPAGDESSAGVASPVSFPVTLAIKPANVVVDGDPTLVYGIEEFPAVAIRVGVPVAVPVPHGNYAVHVIERTSGRRVPSRLDPGREVHVAFTAQAAGDLSPSPSSSQ